MEKSLLTICVFAYNHECYIARALESVLSQKTSFDFDIIVVDDCSTDNTRAVIDKVVSVNDRIKRKYNSRNLGVNENFVSTILQVRTKYVCTLGGDDYWIDDRKLEKQVSLMEKDSSISYVLTAYKLYDEREKCFTNSPRSWKWNMPTDRKKRILSFFSEDWSYYPLGSSCCYRVDCVQKGFENHLNIIANNLMVGEGTITHVSICLYGNRYVAIPDITTVYTVRSRSVSHFEDKVGFYNFRKRYLDLKLFVCKELGIPMWMQIKYVFIHLLSLLAISLSCKRTDLFRQSIKELSIPSFIKYVFLLFSYDKIVYGLARQIKRKVREVK